MYPLESMFCGDHLGVVVASAKMLNHFKRIIKSSCCNSLGVLITHLGNVLFFSYVSFDQNV